MASGIETERVPWRDGVQTIFFDLDGTLIFHEPDSFDVIREFCAEIGQPLDPETERRGRRMRHQYFVDPAIRDKLEGLSGDGFWQHFNGYLLEALSIEGDMDRLVRELGERFGSLDLVYDCPQAGCQTLEALRDRGYGLGLITNRQNVERFYQIMDEMELRPYFDVALASGEVGVTKPEPDIFYVALDQAGASAEHSIYVGDNYWADVVGAQRAGVTPVLFDPYRLFPEADCLILDRIDDLLPWLP
jgi:HAD superfamily hydrolase (TIGR01549 family)